MKRFRWFIVIAALVSITLTPLATTAAHATGCSPNFSWAKGDAYQVSNSQAKIFVSVYNSGNSPDQYAQWSHVGGNHITCAEVKTNKTTHFYGAGDQGVNYYNKEQVSYVGVRAVANTSSTPKPSSTPTKSSPKPTYSAKPTYSPRPTYSPPPTKATAVVVHSSSQAPSRKAKPKPKPKPKSLHTSPSPSQVVSSTASVPVASPAVTPLAEPIPRAKGASSIEWVWPAVAVILGGAFLFLFFWIRRRRNASE